MGSSWKTRKKCVDPFIVVHDETKIVCIRTDFIVYKICIILAAAMGWQGGRYKNLGTCERLIIIHRGFHNEQLSPK